MIAQTTQPLAERAGPAALPINPTQARPMRATVIVLIGLGFVAGEAPLLYKFFVDLWQRPQYQFFPLLLLAIGCMAVSCMRDIPADSVRPGRRLISLLFWLAAWAALIAGAWLYLKWLAPISTLLLFSGCIWMVGGGRAWRALLPVFVMSALLIPPPGHFDDLLLVALRRLAVQCSGKLLDALGVPLLIQGATLQIPAKRLMIEEACSGINSMLAVLSFTVLLCFWKRLRPWSLLLLLPAAFAYVFWANVLRIGVCALAKHRMGIDLFSGTPHELLGLVLFAGCMGLVFSTAALGQLLFNWDAPPSLPMRPPRESFAPKFSLAAPGIAALVFFITGIVVWQRTADAWPHSRLPGAVVFHLPSSLAGWTRVDADVAPTRAEVSGLQSHLWQYRSNNRTVTVALDYPFYGYHEATTCYAMAGWKISASQPRAMAANNSMEVTMRLPPFARGNLMFALCDEAGRWSPPMQMDQIAAHPLQFARHRALATPLAQVQVFAVDRQEIDAEATGNIQALFAAAADSLRQQIADRQWERP